MNPPIRSLFAPVGLLFLLAAAPAALHAQLPKLFVASFGNDANDGTRNAPKRNFQAAHNAIAAGGEIVALDTAGYGTLNITKAITVTSPPGVTGLISVSAPGALAVNIAAGSSDAVVLRGLTIENIGGSSGAGNAVLVNNAAVGTLELSDCTIQGFTSYGVYFRPTNAAALIVKDCTVRGGGGASVGLYISPTPNNLTKASIDSSRFETGQRGIQISGSVNATVRGCEAGANSFGFDVESAAQAHFQDCTAPNNFYGFYVLGINTRATLQNCSASGNATAALYVQGGSKVTAQDSAFSNNGAGTGVVCSQATTVVTLQTCNASLNEIGVNADGGTVRLDGCTVTLNNTNGVQQGGGGSILSRGNNTFAGNTANTSFSSYSAQ